MDAYRAVFEQEVDDIRSQTDDDAFEGFEDDENEKAASLADEDETDFDSGEEL